jgi:hypothetical protein
MYILLTAILALWFYSVYVFAKWRFHCCLNKGVVHETVLHDHLTNLYLRGSAGITLALIIYIVY